MMNEQTEKKEITQDETIDAFEEILSLSEKLPLTHEKFMSVEDAIREMVSTMPEAWAKENMTQAFFDKCFED